MKLYDILSRRPVVDKVDFSPDPTPGAPARQLHKLVALLSASNLGPDDIEDCAEGLTFLREFSYRKIFTGTTHEQFLETDRTDPKAIDWLIAVAGVDNEHYQSSRRK